MTAGVMASLNAAGVLNVVGTAGDDHLYLRQIGKDVSIEGVSGSWSTSKVKSIAVDLRDGGNDYISINSLANGGNKALKEQVTVLSGAGQQHVLTNDGHDVYFTGVGSQLQLPAGGGAALNGTPLNLTTKIVTSLKSGVLTVTATNASDNIAFRQTSGKISIVGVSGTWVTSKVQSIIVRLQDGNDHVSLDSFANGGNQLLSPFVTIYSGNGAESVHVASGHDVSFSGPGHTLLVRPNGTAELDGAAVNWRPPTPTTATFGGTVWEDHNGNGVRDSGDQGLAGCHILINGTDRATTDANGNWSVANLTPGSYTVQEVSQSGWTETSGNAGYSVAAVAGVSTGNLSFSDFKNIAASGFAWEDHNGNGLWEAGDIGVAGWHILINGVDRATTDVYGHWSVANLGPGTLTVQELSQSGWTGTAGAAGFNFATSSGVDTGLNFGDFKNIAASGFAWEDHNGNGLWEAGDIGVAGWHILINGVDRATTDVYGHWSVSNLGPGTYAIQEVSQSGWSETSGNAGYSVNASSGLDNGNLSFGDFSNIPAPPSTNWFDTHVTDAALRSLGHNLYTDNLIDRGDMISLLRETESGNLIDATELADLRAIVANTVLFGSLDYVDQLASDIVNGSAANAKYLGGTLGNLASNSSSTQMDNLVNKWFLGLDHPVASGDSYNTFSSYRQFAGSLFVNGATYDDIKQGYVGDCYLVSSLAEAALRDNSAITNMFIVNGDGTYTLKFYNSGVATYLSVDSYLPADGNGRLIYAGVGMVYNNAGNELWTALAEKGYVQLNELGWERSGLSGSGQNAYSAISGGYIYAAQGIITGQATVAFATTGTAPNQNFNTFVTAFNAGKLIGFATPSTPASSSIVGNHAYAVVGYDSVNQTVTMFNPWGIQYGLVTMTWSQIQQNFIYFDRTA